MTNIWPLSNEGQRQVAWAGMCVSALMMGFGIAIIIAVPVRWTIGVAVISLGFLNMGMNLWRRTRDWNGSHYVRRE